MPHVIITGGSSGIGAAIAAVYAARGADITLIARSGAALEATAHRLVDRFGSGGCRVHWESADVVDAEGLAATIARSEERLGPCAVLVTSAGTVQPGRFAELSPAAFDAQMRVNLTGTVNAVRAVYAGMERRQSGAILMVSSGAGLIGIYGYTAYCASKYAVYGFAEALRLEAKGTGIRVAICFPPDTDTPQLASERSARPAQAEAIIGITKPWSAAAVARLAVAGLDRGSFTICPGLQLRLLARFGSLAMPFLRIWFDRKVAAAGTRAAAPDMEVR